VHAAGKRFVRHAAQQPNAPVPTIAASAAHAEETPMGDTSASPANRRRWIQGSATAVGAAAVAPRLFAQAAPVRVGYAIARTGPWTAGAQVSQEPNYLLWAEQVNAAGGLDVKGTKRPIELVGYDDRSETETCVRTYEKLMGSDKVDMILPPWGSGANFALAPLANRFGYPMLAPTALSRKLIDMNLPYFFSLLQQPDKMMGALVDMLVAQQREEHRHRLHGRPVRPGELRRAEQRAEEDQHPGGGSQELSAGREGPVAGAARDEGPEPRRLHRHHLSARHHAGSRQAREIGFNPKYFYASVGTAFQLYKNVMTQANTEGVIGMGSWNVKTSPGAKAYFDAHM
jgi:branched-chain amino acid transport system substrate-binding protein